MNKDCWVLIKNYKMKKVITIIGLSLLVGCIPACKKDNDVKPELTQKDFENMVNDANGIFNNFNDTLPYTSHNTIHEININLSKK